MRILSSTGAVLALIASFASSAASAATLTVTPDAFTYQVGDTITLNVFGDPEGEATNGIFGMLLFDEGIATYVDSQQQPLITQFGMATWVQQSLQGGVDAELGGFAEAFDQIWSLNQEQPSNTLIATVTLLADSAGLLDLEWNTEGDRLLDFFSLTNAPGTSVLIIPEPSTGALVALGLVLGGVSAARFWLRR